MTDSRLTDYTRKMGQALEVLAREFSGLRTGRASVNLLDPIKVDAYGSLTPLNQVANVAAPESRMLLVQVWDKGMVKSVEKAIRESNLGLNPSVDGSNVRVPVPPLNEERRAELTKVAAKYAEDCKIAVRNVRRDAMDMLKGLEKSKDISEDEHKKLSAEVQKFTDEHISKIDTSLSSKQKEIVQI